MKIKILLLLFVVLFFVSCSNDDSTTLNEVTFPEAITPTIAPLPPGSKAILPLTVRDHNLNITAKYQAVRIGEYLWMNSNINHLDGQPFTKKDIELILLRYRMDVNALNNVSLDDINKYCGPYYDRYRFEYLEDRKKTVVLEGSSNGYTPGWSAASTTDFKQLFAMCGDASELEVRLALTVKPGANPVAKDRLTYWFEIYNSNKYGFNLMPGGARFNGPQTWEIKHNHDGTDNETIHVTTGDFYGLTQAAIWQTWDGKVSIDDLPRTETNKSWHWLPIRWCRKLTDQELGYKLYINQAQTDIVKLDLSQATPSGYSVLPNGYIRGFYVQFILDNPNPTMTVPQIVTLAKKRE